jgi:uncharacterized BrkB/YihY/UPF0761 family membrane protein
MPPPTDTRAGPRTGLSVFRTVLWFGTRRQFRKAAAYLLFAPAASLLYGVAGGSPMLLTWFWMSCQLLPRFTHT